MIRFNMNQTVKVKLTDLGLKILKEKHEKTREEMRNTIGIDIGEFDQNERLDKVGYYREQLWVVMQIFGPHMETGNNIPFETDILLLSDEEDRIERKKEFKRNSEKEMEEF